METDVIIVGAGPSGLMAACQLASFGLSVFIFDKKNGPTKESRALLVTARSMELYQQMGLSDSVLKQSNGIKNASIYIDGSERLNFPIGSRESKISEFPCFQIFEQSRNEELLLHDLTGKGQKVHWDTELVNLVQTEEHVNILVKGNKSTSTEFPVKAKYLLACDGARSKVRELLNIKFKGGTYKRNFFVADAMVNWDQPADKIIALPAASDFMAFFPMDHSGKYRILGNVPDDFEQDDSPDQAASLTCHILKNSGLPLMISKTNWTSVYQLQHRCAEKFQEGRCFLIGDAAHLHSPAGGQGMNTGLQDSANLSWKLALVVKGQANPSLLGTYHSERYPFARWLLRFTDRIFKIVTSTNPLIRLFRNRILPSLLPILRNKSQGEAFFRLFSQTTISYKKSPLSKNLSTQKLKFTAGDRCPYVKVAIGERIQSCYLLFKKRGFHLLIIGDMENQTETTPSLQKLLIIHHLALTAAWEIQGVTRPLYILLRPDNYIALLSDKLEAMNVEDYFNALKNL